MANSDVLGPCHQPAVARGTFLFGRTIKTRRPQAGQTPYSRRLERGWIYVKSGIYVPVRLSTPLGKSSSRRQLDFSRIRSSTLVSYCRLTTIAPCWMGSAVWVGCAWHVPAGKSATQR